MDSGKVELLEDIVSRLSSVRDAAITAGLGYAFFSEIDHLVKTAEYNLREQTSR